LARLLVGLVLAAVLAGCAAKQRVTYEYEPTQVYTSSDPSPTTTTTISPRRWEGRKDW
jgi:ABC-type uncharacterized transport system auxiliary subunit